MKQKLGYFSRGKYTFFLVYLFLFTHKLNLIKMKILLMWVIGNLSHSVTIRLATIGVCVFYASASVGAFFICNLRQKGGLRWSYKLKNAQMKQKRCRIIHRKMYFNGIRSERQNITCQKQRHSIPLFCYICPQTHKKVPFFPV